MIENENMELNHSEIEFKDTKINQAIRKKAQELGTYRYPKLGMFAMQSSRDAFEELQEHADECHEFIYFMVHELAMSGSGQFQQHANLIERDNTALRDKLTKEQINAATLKQENDYLKSTAYKAQWAQKIKETEERALSAEKNVSALEKQIAELTASNDSLRTLVSQAKPEADEMQRRIDELAAENEEFYNLAMKNYNSGIAVQKELDELKARSDMQARKELNMTARKLQASESEVDDLKKVIDQKDSEIERLKAQIEELTKPAGGEPVVIPAAEKFKTAPPQELIEKVVNLKAAGTSLNKMAQMCGVSKDRVKQCLEFAAV